MRTLVVILLAGTIGFLAGRGPVHPLRGWVPLFAVSSPATGPTEGLAGDNREPAPPPVPATPEVAGDLTADEQRRVEIFRRASASVVHIANIAVRQNPFSFDVLQIQQGTGEWVRL